MLPGIVCLAVRLPSWQAAAAADVTDPGVKNPSGGPAVAPAGKLLVSCCPGLQHLELRELRKSATRAVLQPLSGLSGLQTLISSPAGGSQGEGWLELCKLTGLRKLYVEVHLRLPRGLVLQLTQLQQLTSLYCRGHGKEVEIKNEVGTLTIKIVGRFSLPCHPGRAAAHVPSKHILLDW